MTSCPKPHCGNFIFRRGSYTPGPSCVHLFLQISTFVPKKSNKFGLVEKQNTRPLLWRLLAALQVLHYIKVLQLVCSLQYAVRSEVSTPVFFHITASCLELQNRFNLANWRSSLSEIDFFPVIVLSIAAHIS